MYALSLLTSSFIQKPHFSFFAQNIVASNLVALLAVSPAQAFKLPQLSNKLIERVLTHQHSHFDAIDSGFLTWVRFEMLDAM